MKVIIYTIFFILFHLPITAQKQANNWIFTDKQWNFNTTPITVSSIPNTERNTNIASISDRNGNLLFYSDGKNAYDRTYNKMPNGSFLATQGTIYVEHQTVIIIPNLANPNLYYIFTNYGAIKGLSYSIVDMRLNNGLGDITQKNIPLVSKVWDGITATLSGDCKSFWVVVHERWTSNFYAYKVDGINLPMPVITTIGPSELWENKLLKFSTTGKKLFFYEEARNNTFGVLYDFDIISGKLSNRIIFKDLFSEMFYVAFSPDDTKLYTWRRMFMSANNSCVTLMQYDLIDNNELAINNSLIPVLSCNNKRYNGANDLRLAPDGKIYTYDNYQQDSILVIQSPNLRGRLCNIRTEPNRYFTPTIPNYLPTFPSNFLGGVYKDFTFSQPCNTLSINFAATSPNIHETYSWNFGDGSTATVQNPTKTYTQAGSYNVSVKIGACEFTKTVIVQATPKATSIDKLNLCSNEIGNLGTNPQTGFAYRWTPAIGLSNPNIANPTVILANQEDTLRKISYKLLVTNINTSCKDSTTVLVTVFPALQPISAGKDSTICHLQTIRLSPKVQTSGIAYSWTPSTGLDSSKVLKPLLKLENTTNSVQKLTYILKATQNNCSIYDTVVISVLPKIQASLIGSNAVCPFAKNMIYTITPSSIGKGVSIVEWQVFGGVATPRPAAEGAGVSIDWGNTNHKAYVKAILQNSLGCKDSIQVEVKIQALQATTTKLAGMDKQICHNQKIEIGSKPLKNYVYVWSEKVNNIDTLLLFSNKNIANPTLTNLTKNSKISTHTYYVEAQNTETGCIYTDSINVTVYPKIEFYAGKDSVICSNRSITLGNKMPANAPENYEFLWSLNNAKESNPMLKNLKITEVLSNIHSANPIFTFVNLATTPLIFRFALTTKFPDSGCKKVDSIRITVLPAIKKYTLIGSQFVCPNSNNSSYKIHNLSKDIFQIFWSISGGIIKNTNVKDSILVDWGNSDVATNKQSFVRAILQNTAGCLDTIRLDIQIQQVLKPSKPVGKTLICEQDGQNISYETNFTNGSSYIWNSIGGVISKQNQNKVSVNWSNNFPTTANRFLWVTENSVTQTDKCAGNSDTLQVQILSSPDSTLELKGNSNPCEFSQNIAYQLGTNLSYNPSSRYIWNIKNGEIMESNKSIKSNIIFVNWFGIGTGKITVFETLANGCTGKIYSLETTISSITNCLKIPTLLTNTDITFPFWRIIGLENYPNSELSIYALTGAKIYETTNYQQNFNFEGLASGMYVYVLQVRKGKEKITYRGKFLRM